MFFFGLKGIACFVIPECKNNIFTVVDPLRARLQTSRRKRILQFFGCEDQVVNIIQRVHDREANQTNFKFGTQHYTRRFFTVLCVTNIEALVFPYSELAIMARDFKNTTSSFYKIMMEQTQKLLYLYLRALDNQEVCQNLLLKTNKSQKLRRANSTVQM